jgi:hypothetical protein
MARYVKIMQNITMEQLQMFEVEVISSGLNIALGKAANQSSTLIENTVPRLASNAVDGDLTSYSHTDCDDPWWVVDLGELVPIELVTIMNRWCDSPSDEAGCLCRLSNATLSLLDEQEDVIQLKMIGDTCGVEELNFEFCDGEPTASPDCPPTESPTQSPSTLSPSTSLSQSPSQSPSLLPSNSPIESPTFSPTVSTSLPQTLSPSNSPTYTFIPDTLSSSSTVAPTKAPTNAPIAVVVTPPPTSRSGNQANSSPAPAPIMITIPSSMALDNFVMPATQEEYNAVVSILQATLQQTLESFLSDGQTLSEIIVTSIGGQTGVVRRRYLASTEVEYVMTLEEICTVNCGSSEDTAASLYSQVTSKLADSVENGAFVTNLKSNAEADGNAASLANVSVLTPTFEQYALETQSPTKNPTTLSPTPKPSTLRPTAAPTSQHAQALPVQPTPSSGGRLSSHVALMIFSAVLLFVII